MSEGTTLRERNIMPKVGPRFFRDGDAVMFEFVVDPNNIIGPRPATKADSEKHREAFSEFAAADAPPVKVQSPTPMPTMAVMAERILAAQARADLAPTVQAAVRVAKASAAKGKPKRKYTRRKAA